MAAGPWDVTALLNAADPKAELAARNLWLTRLLEWLRHPASKAEASPASDVLMPVPLPVRRVKLLLTLLERNPVHAENFAKMWASVWRDVDATALFADVGFASRMALWSEFFLRLRLHVLPGTVDTHDLGELFGQLFPDEADEHWLLALDDALLARMAALFKPEPATALPWREPMLSSLTILISAVHAAGLSGPLRLRMSPSLLADQPFEQLPRAAEAFKASLHGDGGHIDPATLRQALQYLRALLDCCRQAALSIPEHLETYGVSVDLMFEVEQLDARTQRIEALLDCLVSDQPKQELLRLTASLVRVVHERRSVRTLFARHYSLMARKVAERSAETGDHYITRSAAEYRHMLRSAAGGGAVIGVTTFIKFAVLALALAPFWSGVWAGVNYAASFVVIHLLHWTVATKQPAMTAPAMAQRLLNIADDDGLAGFVDEVAHLLRSQIAGIVGNVALVIPVVAAVQGISWAIFGAPLVGVEQAEYVLHSLSFFGPSLLFAAFTGVLLFASSLIAGWVENWFVFYRLESAIAWNPAIITRLGAARAHFWGQWWAHNISGLAANVSLGLLLGLSPALLGFIGLPLDVRHVTLSTGQLAAAVGTLGWQTMTTAAFWWTVPTVLLVGVLNLGVSFYLAFKVALRSRGIQLADRARVSSAVWRRLREQPRSFLLPPRQDQD